MVTKNLISLQHPFVKYLVSLRQDKALRKTERKVLVSGKNLVSDLLASGIACQALFLTDKAFPYPDPYHVSEEVMRKITGLPHPDGVAALICLPSWQELRSCSSLLVLDGISDPGNLGTLLRTALALGWEGVFFLEGGCDPFNDKALRAAKGATFHLRLQEGSWEDFLELSSLFTVYIADKKGEPLPPKTLQPPYALILSHEAKGARKEAKQLFHPLTIPMRPTMESLNVASAGAILLYMLQPQEPIA